MDSLAASHSASAFFEQLRKNVQTQGGVRLPVAAGAATILAALWYAGLFALEGTYLRILFYDRGWIPPLCAWLFFLCLALLALKWRQIGAEAKATESAACRDLLAQAQSGGAAGPVPGPGPGGPGDWNQIAGPGGAGFELGQAATGDANLILVRRLRKGVQQLLKGGNSSEVGSVLYDQAEADYHIAESSYFLVKFLVWVVPILGFLGTVIGIATAMGDFGGVVAGADNLQGIKTQIGGITDSLGLAFETTLVALVMSALMMLALAFVQKREEDMLATIDQFTVDNLVSAAAAGSAPARIEPTPSQPIATGDLGEVLSSLQRLQEDHNEELKKLSSTFEQNASALGSAAALSETLQLNKELQQKLEATIQQFNQVTGEYTRTLRSIYNLPAQGPPEV